MTHHMLARKLALYGAVLGALAVALGAFGAHALQGRLDSQALGWYDTAFTYHALHALALLATSALLRSGTEPHSLAGRAARCTQALLFGTLVFSGSLYTMAVTGWTWLGAVTPIGGVLLIAGWLAVAMIAARG